MKTHHILAAFPVMAIAALAWADKPLASGGSNNGGGGGKPPPPPVTYTLQSAALRLTVKQTYGFSVTEIATGNVLLNENLVTFTIGSTALSPTAISNVVVGATTLDGDLALNTRTTAHVHFHFATADNLEVTLTCTNATPVSIAESFADVSGERYYGVWENALPTALDNRGISSGYDGVETTRTKGVFASSARAPFYFTNKNYAVYANTESQGTYSLGVNGNTSMKFNSAALQYNILHGGSPKEMIAAHNALAGPAFASAMPPDWAFSTIYWRDDSHQLPPQNAGITNAQDLTLDDFNKLAAHQMHAGAIWLDRPYGTGGNDPNVAGWGNLDFDTGASNGFYDPSTMAGTLNNGGMQLLLWVANKASNGIYTEGAADGYEFSGHSDTNNNSPAIDLRITGGVYPGGAYPWLESKLGILDNQVAAWAPYTGRISGYKIDRGGEGEMPAAVINVETTLMQKMCYENMQALNGSNFFNFTRNINGKGRQYAAVWSGDPNTDWMSLHTSVMNGIRSGLINFPMWGSDTGGYVYTSSTWSQELFSRWVAFSAYSPMMEIVEGPGRNMFYDFSPATLATAAKYTNLHHDLIPYTRSALASARKDGVPIMRAMVLEFPADAAVADMADEYMYGPNILVAPVSTQGATSRTVYLPALPNGGRWIDYNNPSSSYDATTGRTITAAAAVGVIPTFVRSGAIIPRGDIVQANNTWTANWLPSLRIDVFPGAALSSFNYYTGTGTSTITAAPISNVNGTGYELVAPALGCAGAFNVHLAAALASVVLNGVVLVAGTDYTYDSVAQVLAVSVAGLGTQTNTLDVYTGP